MHVNQLKTGVLLLCTTPMVSLLLGLFMRLGMIGVIGQSSYCLYTLAVAVLNLFLLEGLFYPLACMLLRFVIWGDLLSNLAYTVGNAVSFFALTLVCLGSQAIFAKDRATTRGSCI